MLILLNKFSLFSAIFLIIYYLKLAVAQCPPSKEQLQPLMSNLKTWYAPIKKLKPGTDPRDVDFVTYKMAKEIFSHKKFAPCNKGFDWKEIEKDAVMCRKECYKPADLSKESVLQDFRECMNKLIPALAMKYTAPSLEACDCFAGKILPKYETKYKKIMKQYFDEFKTLKHRKK